MVQVIQQWRVIVVQCVVISTDWIWVDIGANAPACMYVLQCALGFVVSEF